MFLDSLSGSETLCFPFNAMKHLEKNGKLNVGMDIRLFETNIRQQVGGSLLSTVPSTGKSYAPTLGKTLGISTLEGLASEGALKS